MKRILFFGILMMSLTLTQANLSQNQSDIKEGRVSWYGKKFHGRTTANGEKFDMHAFTAAHKTLKFNTKVKITNKGNGKSVIVRINDRGPYVGSRVFDLSKAAFDEIGDIDHGTMTVTYEIL